MKKFIPIILLLIFASQNFAQEYFPLQVGNKWHMPGTGSYCTGDSASLVCPDVELKDTLLFQIFDDTLMPNGKKYSILSEDFAFGKYVRSDTSFIYFYDDSISAEVPVFDLKAVLYSTDSVDFQKPATKYAIYLGEITETSMFGENTKILKYWVDGDRKSYYDKKDFSIAFSDKFGIVYYNTENWDGDTQYKFNYSLSECLIGGERYGETLEPINFPLAVNNSWTFYGTGAECFHNENGEGICLLIEHRDTLTFTVQKDTVFSNSNTYYKIVAVLIENPGFEFNPVFYKPLFMRADENYLYVYDDSSNSDIPIFNLTGTIFQDDTVYTGSGQNTAYNIWLDNIEETVKFQQPVRVFSYYLFELDTLLYVGSDRYYTGISSKFGFTGFGQTYWFKTDDQLRPYQSYAFKYTLGRCNIGGVVYGDRIGVEPDDEPNAPKSFSLSQNYPNPFNPSTTIEFAVPKQSRVKLTVFDVLGREISVLANDVYSAGSYKATFNGSNLPSGVYLYRLDADSYSQTRKFILLK